MSATKTPEQLAEELAWKFAKKAHGALRKNEKEMIEVNGPEIDYLFWGNAHGPLAETVTASIPLTELIAVARAAKKLRAEVGDLGKEVGGQSMDDAYEETKQSLTALEAKLPEL